MIGSGLEHSGGKQRKETISDPPCRAGWWKGLHYHVGQGDYEAKMLKETPPMHDHGGMEWNRVG